MFIQSLHLFRGIAICLIVFGHAMFEMQPEGFADGFVFALLKNNNTMLFVFISGFLFYHLSAGKFNYKKLINNKFFYIFVPYLILVTLPTIYRAESGYDINGFMPEFFHEPKALTYLWYYATGKGVIAYWYIPTIMIIFLCSPLILKLCESKYLGRSIIALMALSMIIHRPVDNANPLHSAIYILPFFLLGCFSAKNKEAVLKWINGKFFILALGVIITASMQAALPEFFGISSKPFFELSTIEISIIQKLCLCFLIFGLLEKYRNFNPPVLSSLANASFAIFFMHGILLAIIQKVLESQGIAVADSFSEATLYTIAIIAICAFGAYICKLILKDKSRYVIGY